MKALIAASFPLLVVLAWAAPSDGQTKTYKTVWKKTVLDKKFRSEGVAVADVNGDGKKDVLVGDVWYAAPDWKMHRIRTTLKGKEKLPADGFNPANYSRAFAVFADDIDGDKLPDQIVVGFPGAECCWYKNPGKEGELWTEYMIQNNACNETPIYADLLGTGKRGLILGHKGEMAFFTPGKDATKPWDKIAISGPGKGIPGTAMFAHGLGAGDLNGDGKLDVLCNGGWWEQPASDPTAKPWTFHPLSVPPCADMHAFDVDGDGRNDIIASSAHNTGLWWFQQKAGKDHPAFVQQEFFPIPVTLAKPPQGHKFSKEEAELYAAISKVRLEQKKVPWRTELKINQDARTLAAVGTGLEKEEKLNLRRVKYEGEIVVADTGPITNMREVALQFCENQKKARHPAHEIGVGVFHAANGKLHYCILLGDRGQFALPGQTHALHFTDMDGDGIKDLVTGRRFWAHGPGGDDHPADPAFLYILKGKKDKTGFTSFEPIEVDDDSGIGTQFAVADINGDGKPDIIISNKRGVYVFEQLQEVVIQPVPPKNDDE